VPNGLAVKWSRIKLFLMEISDEFNAEVTFTFVGVSGAQWAGG
jgi:hypothetical protein